MAIPIFGSREVFLCILQSRQLDENFAYFFTYRSDAMDIIGQYTVLYNIENLNDHLQLWACEMPDGGSCEVLTIQATDKYIKRTLYSEVIPLLKREISGFQTILERGDDEGLLYLVYENLDGFVPLSDGYSRAKISSLFSLVEGLRELKNENREMYLLSPNWIYINPDGEIKVKYIGLFEIFKKQGLLEKQYVSPIVWAWVEDSKRIRPNFQDDMYSLIHSFRFLFSDPSDHIFRALDEDRKKRFSKYTELKEVLETSKTEERRSNYVNVVTQNGSFQLLLEVLNSMTGTMWIKLERSKSKQDNQICGRFSTETYSGFFFVNDDNHLFLPSKSIKNEKDIMLIQSRNSFCVPFEFSDKPSTFNCTAYFTEQFDKQNQLAELHKLNAKNTRKWRVLPDKEREYIENNAFSVCFHKREEMKGTSPRLKFYLTTKTHIDWKKVKEIKNKEVLLHCDDLRIGKIQEHNPKDNILFLKDIHCSIDEVSHQGTLLEDVRLETSQYKKQVEACKMFDNKDVVNPQLCSILSTPGDTEMLPQKLLQNFQFENFEDELFNLDLQNDETQREAVLEAMHYKPLYLIQGPPGTGKTTVIVELVRQILKRQSSAKILITSQSNLAVDNVLEKFNKINQQEGAHLKFMRLASSNAIEKDNISADIIPHTFEKKLRNWAFDTEKRATRFFKNHFQEQEKHPKLIDIYLEYQHLQR